jgi:hypothetical protein
MSKTLQVKNHLSNGDIKKALKIASTFYLTFSKEQLNILKIAYECIVHKNFYQQILNTDEFVEKATLLLKEKF